MSKDEPLLSHCPSGLLSFYFLFISCFFFLSWAEASRVCARVPGYKLGQEQKTRNEKKIGRNPHVRAYVATKLLPRWDYSYAMTHKANAFADYNHACMWVSWIISKQGLLLLGYTGSNTLMISSIRIFFENCVVVWSIPGCCRGKQFITQKKITIGFALSDHKKHGDLGLPMWTILKGIEKYRWVHSGSNSFSYIHVRVCDNLHLQLFICLSIFRTLLSSSSLFLPLSLSLSLSLHQSLYVSPSCLSGPSSVSTQKTCVTCIQCIFSSSWTESDLEIPRFKVVRPENVFHETY